MIAWYPTPFLKASFALHGVAAAGLLAAPGLWPWALAAVVANHAILTTAGLLPRSTLLGANLTRLPAAAIARREVAITIDDGPDPEVTPQVLDLLDAAGAKASFFCIGWRARENPALCREIVARGHRIENHGLDAGAGHDIHDFPPCIETSRWLRCVNDRLSPLRGGGKVAQGREICQQSRLLGHFELI